MEVDRKAFLKSIESAGKGSMDPTFTKGHSVISFLGDEVAGWCGNIYISSQLPEGVELEGTFLFDELVKVIKKISSEKVGVEVTEEEIIISSKRKRAGVRRVDIDPLELGEATPDSSSYVDLDSESFAQGLKLCWPNCSTDLVNFRLTLINITPDWMESCNNFQAIRYSMKFGKAAKKLLSSPIMIPVDSARILYEAKPNQMSVQEDWVFFRNVESGTLYAVPKYGQEYPDLSKIFDGEGSPFKFPSGMDNALDAASIFAESKVSVTLNKNRMVLRGEGESGWYEETRRIDKVAKALSFMAHAESLKESVKKASKCTLTHNILRVQSDDFVYVVSLSQS